MRRPAFLVLPALLASCATAPPWPHDADDQRHKEGSLRHAYGAGFVTAGIAGLVGAATLGLGELTKESQVDVNLVPTAIAGAFGVAWLVIGVALVNGGNKLFTPPPAGWVPPAPKAKKRRAWGDDEEPVPAQPEETEQQPPPPEQLTAPPPPPAPPPAARLDFDDLALIADVHARVPAVRRSSDTSAEACASSGAGDGFAFRAA